jgi:nucleotide-binding universal stress UspA family protein
MGNGQGLIVVGVDGSPHARRALDWALAEARLRGGRCLLIHAHEFGVAGASPYVPIPVEELTRDAQAVLDRELTHARQAGGAVEGRVVLGGAARALVEASAEAGLLVVGSRGRGGLAGALLGSVSTACVHHATCPVVVIPPPDRVSAARHM